MKNRVAICFMILFMLRPFMTQAQQPNTTESPNPSLSADDQAPAVFKHSLNRRWWISGQINIISQWHPHFRALYSGVNSLKPRRESATSSVLTLYTGLQLTKTLEFLVAIESAGGRGLSNASGLAGFTDLDVVRNPDLGAKPYLARLMVRKIIPLSRQTGESIRGPLGLAVELPGRRLEIRAGKFGIVDFFDVNAVGSDSHLQFMNWTVDNNGGYDYAADTRGYTWGLIVEYQDRRWALRFAEALMPKIANGIQFDWNLRRARGENMELEIRHAFIPNRIGVLRLLTYVNHANMGSYRDSIRAFEARQEPVPTIEAHRRQARVKYGYGVSVEQPITDRLRVFGRWGWNEGRHESFAYTEVNQSVAFGTDWKGVGRRRPQDKVGLAFAINGLSGDHRRYLALGGRGFLLGDSALNYGYERIVESYYTLHLWRGIYAAVGLQHITNPGYNRDRGPVLVPTLRWHIDF
ncbi:MAG: carbohydrate porin [Acidobacteria bacterium]|nr:carbohydrate porin [Acidobacteriota bacterium]